MSEKIAEDLKESVQFIKESIARLAPQIDCEQLEAPQQALSQFPAHHSAQRELEDWLYPNLLFNLCLWKLEDLARDPVADDALIASVKRRIDGFNQARNDQVEKINIFLLENRYSNMRLDSPSVTETPGSVFDRLVIMSLKSYFLSQGLEAKLADPEIKKLAQQKHQRANQQLADLEQSLLYLHSQLLQGKVHFKLYNQLKLYNDKRFNPYMQKASS